MDLNSTRLNETLIPLVNGLFVYPYEREHFLFASVLNCVWPVLLFSGLLSNATNIVVFLKVGVKDSVSTLLLALSISDFMFLNFFTPSILRESFSGIGTYQSSDFYEVHILCFWPAFSFYDYSAYISVFLGVARCACVAIPLRFKSAFTVKRTVAVLLALFCADVLVHLPMLTAFRLGWVRDPSTNTSSLSLMEYNWEELLYKQRINDILNKNVIPWVTFVIMISSVALLSFKLFESSKVRSSSYKAPSISEKLGNSSVPNQTNLHKLSPKDVKVVQSVILVCSIFIAAQLPSLIYTPIRSSSSEFYAVGRLKFLASICMKVEWTFMMVNASLNILVYYNYNSKFKSVFRSLLNLN